MRILGMMGEIRHAIGEASGYGKAGGDDFSGLFRFLCKIANPVQDCIVEGRCIF